MSNQKILLIDYDPASINKTATPLTKAGYSVEVAKDGLAGLAAFDRLRPALVLVEAMLPRKHGFEVCQEIKAKPEGKSTPVLITSAVCRGRKYRMDALQIYGCDEYIEKPIPDNELVSMIGRLIAEASQATEEVKQDLSAAIDRASDSDGPMAIESMTDDELEAKIDSLLMAPTVEAPSAAVAAPATPPQATEPEPAATASPAGSPSAVAPEPTAGSIAVSDSDEPMETVGVGEPVPAKEPVAETSEVEPAPNDGFDAGSEMERRLEAMVQVDTATIDAPAIDPVPEAGPPADAPAVKRPAEVAPADKLVNKPTEIPAATGASEWTETAPAKGGSKAIPFAIAAIVVLSVAGFFAFRQGWFGAPVGGASESAADSPAALDVAPRGPALPIRTEPAGPEAAVAATDPESALAEPSDPALEPIATTPAEETSSPPADPGEQPVEVARNDEPAPFKGRTKAQIDAAARRQRDAERAMNAAAGSLKSELLSEGAIGPATTDFQPAVPVELDDDLIGTPEPPKPTPGKLYDITEVDEAPVPKKFEQPVYDALARRLRQQGEILVSVLIDDTGRVTSVDLIKSIPNSRLNNSAVQAAMNWTYEPAMKDGVPVSVWKTERILFRLD